MNAIRSARIGAFALCSILLLTACGTATPGPSPSPTPGARLSVAQLKYALLDRYGALSWCDPDFYPIAQQDEQVLARQRLAEIQADAPTYDAILDRLEIDSGTTLSDAQTLGVYRQWKLLNAVGLRPSAGGHGFDLIFIVDEGLGTGRHVVGTIDESGTIAVATDENSFLTACPICLARGTLIDTPHGAVAVEGLRPGDLVWTVDSAGNRVAAPLVRVGSTPVPSFHRVVHVVLADGRELWVSPGHPLADGRVAGELRSGAALDGSTVITAALVAYGGGATFDILPASASGLYWANGILIGSTLRTS